MPKGNSHYNQETIIIPVMIIVQTKLTKRADAEKLIE